MNSLELKRGNKYIINSLDELNDFAENISFKINKGTTIGLIGEIGAGKTAFIKKLMPKFGVFDVIKSPTYTIVSQYETDNFIIYHTDIYRINDEDELYNIGFEDYFGRNSLVIVEWVDMYKDYVKELSLKYIELTIDVDIKGVRTITITDFDMEE